MAHAARTLSVVHARERDAALLISGSRGRSVHITGFPSLRAFCVSLIFLGLLGVASQAPAQVRTGARVKIAEPSGPPKSICEAAGASSSLVRSILAHNDRSLDACEAVVTMKTEGAEP
jgi:hypothetical protein